MTFTTTGAALGMGRPIPPEWAFDIEDVLDAAEAWQAGRLTLSVAATIGTIAYRDQPSPRYTRYLAITHTALDDRRRPALMAMLDRMVRANHTVTRQGILTADEMHLHDEAIRWLRQNPRTEAA